MACLLIEQNKAALARGCAAGAVEGDGTAGTNLAEGQVEATLILNRLLVGLAIIKHIFFGHTGIDGAHVGVLNVDVVKENFAQARKSRGALGIEGEEFANVENHNIAEIDLPFLMHADKG